MGYSSDSFRFTVDLFHSAGDKTYYLAFCKGLGPICAVHRDVL